MDRDITLKPEQGLINGEFMNMVDHLEKALLSSDLPGIAKGDDGTFPLKTFLSQRVYMLGKCLCVKEGL